MEDLLSIGRFSRLSGLSIGALRHYDELDLLRPAVIDPETGYRRYRRDQLAAAGAISRLRDLEMPLDDIRAVLATDEDGERRRLIGAHRARVEARTFRLQYNLQALRQLSDRKEPIVSTPPGPPELDTATRRALAVGLFNHVWTLLETPDRTAEQDDEMVHAAHASRYHWGEVGEKVNVARGEWQCSRVYAVLGRAEPAIHHARRCVEVNESNPDREDWDLASACEAMARALAVVGDADGSAEWRARARAELDRVADPADREIIEGDLATIPA